MDMLPLVARWLHILSATLAVGVPIYVRLALMPALETLDEENRSRVREAIAARWRMIVYMLIVVFLAIVMFFLSSALAGRSKGLAYFRNNAKVWTTFLISVGVVVVGISGILRFM